MNDMRLWVVDADGEKFWVFHTSPAEVMVLLKDQLGCSDEEMIGWQVSLVTDSDLDSLKVYDSDDHSIFYTFREVIQGLTMPDIVAGTCY